jgi:hypothetical protein
LIPLGELGQHQIKVPYFGPTENEASTGRSTTLRSGRDDNFVAKWELSREWPNQPEKVTKKARISGEQ